MRRAHIQDQGKKDVAERRGLILKAAMTDCPNSFRRATEKRLSGVKRNTRCVKGTNIYKELKQLPLTIDRQWL